MLQPTELPGQVWEDAKYNIKKLPLKTLFHFEIISDLHNGGKNNTSTKGAPPKWNLFIKNCVFLHV